MKKEMEKLSRRDFLKGSLAGLAAVAGGVLLKEMVEGAIFYDPTWKVELDFDGKVNFGEAVNLAKRFDKMYDLLPEIPRPASNQEAFKWALEVVPMFEYNGITSRGVFPQYTGFLAFTDAGSHNHTAGRSDCWTYGFLNARFANDVSSWYEEEDWPLILIHELAHVQQGEECGKHSSEDIENTAQLMALEVAASLVNGSNKLLLRPLVGEFRSLAVSTAWGIALDENRMPDFERERARLSPGEEALARFERSKRYWASAKTKLREILYKYNEKPLGLLIDASRGNGKISGLALPPDYAPSRGRYTAYPRDLAVDDILYFLRHAEGLVKEAYDGRI